MMFRKQSLDLCMILPTADPGRMLLQAFVWTVRFADIAHLRGYRAYQRVDIGPVLAGASGLHLPYSASARSSRGSKPNAAASFLTVLGCGLLMLLFSMLFKVAELMPANSASSRCEYMRSSRVRLTLSPVLSFTTIIVANFVPFRRRFVTGID